MKKKLITRVVVIILLLFMIYGGFKYYNNYRQIQELEHEVTRLEKQISSAREQRERLQIELNNINNPEYIEKIARKELGLVKPGELLIIPVEEEENNK